MSKSRPGARAVRAGRLLRRVVQALLLVTIVCVIVPFSPALPMGDSEASWAFGLNQAVAQGMTFGRDILYTLGPYAGLYTRTYHPATDHFTLLGSLYLGLLFAVVLIVLTERSPWYLLFALWVVLAGFLFARDPLFFSYPLLAGLCCCKLLNPPERDRVDNRVGAILILGLFSPFGLLPLVKGSYLVLCAAVALLAMLAMALYRKWSWAFAVVASMSASLIVFWVLSGQPATGLPRYLAAMVPVISGYSDAMFKHGSTREIACYMAASAVLLGAVLWERRVSPSLRLFLGAVFAVTLFIAFKGGFVRHDGHAVAAAASLLLAALFFALAFPAFRTLASLALCALAWIYIDPYTRSASPESTLERVTTTFTKTLEGYERRENANAILDRAFNRRLRQLREELELPRFPGTSDIYSFSQSYLIASGNTWNPRPVFQSYAAYTPALAAMNRDHLLEARAPDNLFFKMEPIDRRLPSTEDGPSWPVMLARYRPVGLEHGYLYLHREAGDTGSVPARRALPGGGSYAFEEIVSVPDGGDALVFAEITVDQGLPAALAALLYKPGELDISLALEDGTERTFRLIPPMARAGFLVSPLIESTAQFARLYGGLAGLSDKRVASFTLVSATGWYPWPGTFEVTFTAVEPPPAIDLGTVYRFAAVAGSEAGKTIAIAEHCDGNIDAINGTVPAPDPFHAIGVLEVEGWLAVAAKAGVLPDAALVVITDARGERRFYETDGMRHPWAGKHFGDPAMEMAGYTAVLDVSGLAGDYTLGLALAMGTEIRVCPEFAIPGSILGTGR